MLRPSHNRKPKWIRQLVQTASWLVVSLMCFSTTLSAEALPQTMMPKAELQPFLQQYCVRCHSGDKQNGQMRFDTVAWVISNGDEAQRWQDVLDILNAGNMPPEDEKQPTTDELSSVLDSMTGALIIRGDLVGISPCGNPCGRSTRSSQHPVDRCRRYRPAYGMLRQQVRPHAEP